MRRTALYLLVDVNLRITFASAALVALAGIPLLGRPAATALPIELIGYDWLAYVHRAIEHQLPSRYRWEAAQGELAIAGAMEVTFAPLLTAGCTSHVLVTATPVASAVVAVKDAARAASFETALAHHPERAGRPAPPESPRRPLV